MPRPLRIALICLLALTVLAGAGWLALSNSGLTQPADWLEPALALAVVSTRSHLRDGGLTTGHDEHDYSVAGVFPGLSPGVSAPADLVVVVHGFNNSADKALNRFDTARVALSAAGFGGGVVGFSWDADTQHDPQSMTGYHCGMRHAALNGPKLAQFLLDYRARQPQARLHLIGYSMGARVALEALYALHSDPLLADRPGAIDSVHLVGAAVENEDVELSEKYGEAIAARCTMLYNYFSPEDNKLDWFYPLKEGDRALGLTGVEHPDRAPANYTDVSAVAELPPYDIAGTPTDGKYGDNHSGYLGTRDAAGELVDDGVMDLVAARIAALGAVPAAAATPPQG